MMLEIPLCNTAVMMLDIPLCRRISYCVIP